MPAQNTAITNAMARNSWQPFLRNTIEQTAAYRNGERFVNADRVCIIGLADGTCWTPSNFPESLKITPEEGANISRIFREALSKGGVEEFKIQGIKLEGQKYMYLKDNFEEAKVSDKEGLDVYGRGRRQSVTLQQTRTAIVIAHCGEGMQPGCLNRGVGVVQDYLIALGM